jgi:hypothetical protein
MTYPAAINRHYETRYEAWGYLAKRGFFHGPDGWRNGRWMARVARDQRGVTVEVWLPS